MAAVSLVYAFKSIKLQVYFSVNPISSLISNAHSVALMYAIEEIICKLQQSNSVEISLE